MLSLFIQLWPHHPNKGYPPLLLDLRLVSQHLCPFLFSTFLVRSCSSLYDPLYLHQGRGLKSSIPLQLFSVFLHYQASAYQIWKLLFSWYVWIGYCKYRTMIWSPRMEVLYFGMWKLFMPIFVPKGTIKTTPNIAAGPFASPWQLILCTWEFKHTTIWYHLIKRNKWSIISSFSSFYLMVSFYFIQVSSHKPKPISSCGKMRKTFPNLISSF